MAADLEVGQNRSVFTTQNNLKKATAAAVAAAPRGRATADVGRATKTGDASWTTIVWAHGLPYTPSNVFISPASAAAGLSAAGGYVDPATITATTFTITLNAAPANAAVVTFSYAAYA